MRRRRFLQLSGAAVTVPLLPGCGEPEADNALKPPSVDPDQWDGGRVVEFDADGVPLDEATFVLPVLAGSALPRSAILMAHVEQPAADLRLRVWRKAEGDGQIVLVKDIPLDVEVPDDGVPGLAKLRVDGLAPATTYRYAFFVDGLQRRSTIGRVRTAFPDDWVWPVTIGATTCTNDAYAPWTALTNHVDEDLDVFCHLGDMVYADGSETEADYRAHWRRALSDPGYRAVLSRQGIVSTWDDHEIDNNYDPETLDPDKERAAKAMFYAHTPMVPRDNGAHWQSFRWGHTVEIIALDCRSERKPSTRNTDKPIYIGEEQMAFLKDRLKNSPAHFKVVLNSVPMTNMLPIWGVEGDRWEGYGAQRGELLAFMEDHALRNVWFLSGDFHVGFVGRLEETGFHRRFWEVAVGPGGNLGNPLGFLAADPQTRDTVFPRGQFTYGAGEIASTTLEFDPLNDTVRVRFVDRNGAVLYDERLRSKS